MTTEEKQGKITQIIELLALSMSKEKVEELACELERIAKTLRERSSAPQEAMGMASAGMSDRVIMEVVGPDNVVKQRIDTRRN